MIEFIRPGTRVWIGENFQIPAMVSFVKIVRDLTHYYGVNYWAGDDEKTLRSLDLERWEIATTHGQPDVGHEVREEANGQQ